MQKKIFTLFFCDDKMSLITRISEDSIGSSTAHKLLNEFFATTFEVLSEHKKVYIKKLAVKKEKLLPVVKVICVEFTGEKIGQKIESASEDMTYTIIHQMFDRFQQMKTAS